MYALPISVEEARGHLGVPTTFDRRLVGKVVTADEIPFTDVELAAIRRVREPRSLAQHGRPWTDPTEEDLELSLGFVNRVLGYWGDSLTRP